MTTPTIFARIELLVDVSRSWLRASGNNNPDREKHTIPKLLTSITNISRMWKRTYTGVDSSTGQTIDLTALVQLDEDGDTLDTFDFTSGGLNLLVVENQSDVFVTMEEGGANPFLGTAQIFSGTSPVIHIPNKGFLAAGAGTTNWTVTASLKTLLFKSASGTATIVISAAGGTGA